MAVFNPEIPTDNIPDYLNLPRPNSRPEYIANTSAGKTLQGVGLGIEGGVGLIDEGIKGVIKQDLYKSIDKERDDFSSALATVKSMVSGGSNNGNPLNANAQATDQDLMPDQGPAPPSAIDKGLSKVNTLQAAYNSNKLSETMYYSRLTQIAKDMRSTYPGYRDYIDQEVSKITGGNPANEYLRSIITDINRSQSNTNKEYEYYEKALVNSGYSQSGQVLQKFQQDRDIPFVQQFLAGNAERNAKIQQDKNAFELADKTRTDLKARAEITANAAAEHAATEFFYNRNLLHDDPSSRTSSQIIDFLADLSLHPEKRDPEAIRNVGTQLQMLQARNYQETSAYLSTVKTKDGQSVADVLGPSGMKDILDKQIGTLYDTQLRLLKDEQLGLVYSTQNAVGDIGYNKALGILKYPTTEGFAQTAAALGKIWPNMSTELQQKVLGSTGDIASQLLKANREQVKQALAQTGGIYAGGQGGNVYTFKQIRDELDKMQSTTHEPDTTKAQAINRTIQVGSTALREKDPTVADSAITTFFDPANRGSLNGLMDDYYDASRGVIKKGRTSAFTQLTDPGITANVWKRAHEGNGLAWDNYTGWAKGEATSALTTMAQTWNKNEEDFAKQQFIRAKEGDIPARTDHHFYWDTDKHQIGVAFVNDKKEFVPIDPETSWRLNPDLFLIRNANKYLQSLKTMATTEGSNPDAYLFKVMKDAGWAPSHLDTKGTSTINQRILKAVISAHTPPEPEPAETGK